MADLTYTGTATLKRTSDTTIGKGEAGGVKHVTALIEIAAAATVGSTYRLARVPSDARFTGASEMYWDDLSTGSKEFDIGLASVRANITSDPDAINDGLAGGTASAGVKMVKVINNIGLPAWDLVNGVTEDPKGEFDVYLSLTSIMAQGGTFVADIYYVLD